MSFSTSELNALHIYVKLNLFLQLLKVVDGRIIPQRQVNVSLSTFQGLGWGPIIYVYLYT